MARHKNGKRIDAYKLVVSGVECLCEVFMVHDVGGIVFRADCEAHDVHIEETSINKVRPQLLKELKERLTLTWKKHILVTLHTPVQVPDDFDEEPDTQETSFTCCFKIEVQPFQVTTIGGLPALRYGGEGKHIHSGHHTYMPKDDIEDAKQGWTGSLDSGTKYTSVIDDTPENRLALRSIMLGLDRVSDAVSIFLNPKTIKKSLARIASEPGLPLLAASNASPKAEAAAPIPGRRRRVSTRVDT